MIQRELILTETLFALSVVFMSITNGGVKLEWIIVEIISYGQGWSMGISSICPKCLRQRSLVVAMMFLFS